jgi:NAD(P)-dependent dehydrogenase (short-subunit alcohol dehydrogenase family)
MLGIERGRAGRADDGVIVTGSSTGLGLETALHLAGAGFRVFAAVRDLASGDGVREAANQRGVALQIVRLDLTDPDSIEQAVATVVAEAGGVFALVNNGGVGLRGAVEDSSEKEIRRVFETNVLGTIALTRAVIPHMRAAGCGRIVTVTSVGGRVPGFGVSIYCASKFAQEGLGEGLALELAPFGIQSIIVEPGMIKTSRWAEHRGTAEGARDVASPYYGLFWASEAIADTIVERSPTTPADVAVAVEAALTDEQPRLRYVVGRGARTVIFLRRHLPERLFERLYYGGQLRRLERSARSAVPPAPAAGASPGAAPAPSDTVETRA